MVRVFVASSIDGGIACDVLVAIGVFIAAVVNVTSIVHDIDVMFVVVVVDAIALDILAVVDVGIHIILDFYLHCSRVCR